MTSKKQALCKAIRKNATTKQRLGIVIREINSGLWSRGGFLSWVACGAWDVMLVNDELLSHDREFLEANIRRTASK
jgi:hypothetical protein